MVENFEISKPATVSDNSAAHQMAAENQRGAVDLRLPASANDALVQNKTLPDLTLTDVTVKDGDNLWKIAREALKQDHTDGSKPSDKEVLKAVQAIEKQNHLANPDLIHAGDHIFIPAEIHMNGQSSAHETQAQSHEYQSQSHEHQTQSHEQRHDQPQIQDYELRQPRVYEQRQTEHYEQPQYLTEEQQNIRLHEQEQIRVHEPRRHVPEPQHHQTYQLPRIYNSDYDRQTLYGNRPEDVRRRQQLSQHDLEQMEDRTQSQSTQRY